MAKIPRECDVMDCTNQVVAYGLCDMHRLRLRDHGHLQSTRPADWGKREKHPLYSTWNWMRRMRVKSSIDSSWEDFWKFVSDVGERPSEKHRLVRLDKFSGYGPNNFQWSEVVGHEDRNEYARQWRKNNPAKAKNAYLKKAFGITLEDYDRMLKEQEGKCSICHGDEPTGNALAVDHCHETKKIRGLLCTNCNKILGHAKDNTDVLFAAIQYLKNV